MKLWKCDAVGPIEGVLSMSVVVMAETRQQAIEKASAELGAKLPGMLGQHRHATHRATLCVMRLPVTCRRLNRPGVSGAHQGHNGAMGFATLPGLSSMNPLSTLGERAS